MIWILARVLKQSHHQKLSGISGIVSLTGYKPKHLTTIGYYTMINHPIIVNTSVQDCWGSVKKHHMKLASNIWFQHLIWESVREHSNGIGITRNVYKPYYLGGTFHIFCAYLKGIGMKMEEFGIEDIRREANIVKSNGSVNSILVGANYKIWLFCTKAILECLESMMYMYERFVDENGYLSANEIVSIRSFQQNPYGQSSSSYG